MARLLYGATSGDYTMTAGGRVIPNAEIEIWDAIEGGTQITDLTDYDGNPCTVVTSGADGLVRFYGPDGENDNLWMDSRQGSRLLVRPTVLTATIGDGSILDEDIAADADINRSKIAGTALTSDSTGVFSVKDFGAVGDGMTDDTAHIQAAIDAAEGAAVHFPPGRYLVEGTLTVPAFTALRGSIAEWGQGGTGITELIFPETGSVTGITCGVYAVIENLLIRGPAAGTSTAIAGPSIHLQNMAVTSFATGIALTDAVYAALDRVELLRNTTGLKLSGCYNVNLYDCRFSHDADSTNTAIVAGTVQSLQMFGGSIENYTKAITVTAGGVNLFGVYFETFIPSPDQDIYGVLFYNKNGVSLLLDGCTIYLNGTDQFVYGGDSTNCVISSRGNYFVSAASAGAVQAFLLPADASNQITLRDDNWMGVGDSTISYVGSFLNAGAIGSAHIELPKGYTSGPWSTDGPGIAFAGRSQQIPVAGWFGWANGVRMYSGIGSPNGAVTANPGCMYLDYNGGAGVTLYVKESGWGTDTGWVGK